MDMSKSTIKAIGSLAMIGVIAAGAFLGVKPQLEEALDLQSQTVDMRKETNLRTDRNALVVANASEEKFAALESTVNDLLQQITPTKDVTNIAGAVVAALIPGIDLISFSHGELDPAAPAYKEPKTSLTPFEAPFDITKKKSGGTASSSSSSNSTPPPGAPTGGASSANPGNPGETGNTVPKLAGAPFVLVLKSDSFPHLMEYLNILQNQKRIISVVSVNSSAAGDGSISATVYAYAFAGSSPAVLKWLEIREGDEPVETDPTEEEINNIVNPDEAISEEESESEETDESDATDETQDTPAVDPTEKPAEKPAS